MIRIDEGPIRYCQELAAELEVRYQTLITFVPARLRSHEAQAGDELADPA